MANEEQVDILRRGVEIWNSWRNSNLGVRPDLTGIDWTVEAPASRDLSRANLTDCDLSDARLDHALLDSADLSRAILTNTKFQSATLKNAKLVNAAANNANFSGANLRFTQLTHFIAVRSIFRSASLFGTSAQGSELIDCDCRNVVLSEAHLANSDLANTDFREADLMYSDLHFASLRNSRFANANLAFTNLIKISAQNAIFESANFDAANLTDAMLVGGNLRNARISRVTMVGTDLRGADLSGAWVYGISAWDLHTDESTKQSALIITPRSQSRITVDGLEVAQFIYLLLNNRKVRHVIDTISTKVVLILGRFTPERKAILNGIRDELHNGDYVPVLFDFEKPLNRDLTETVATLAHIARFVIADITDARSIPQELERIIPALPSVPIQPLLVASQQEYGMFEHLRRFPWVLEPFLYEDGDALLNALRDRVIGPAEEMARKQTAKS